MRNSHNHDGDVGWISACNATTDGIERCKERGTPKPETSDRQVWYHHPGPGIDVIQVAVAPGVRENASEHSSYRTPEPG